MVYRIWDVLIDQAFWISMIFIKNHILKLSSEKEIVSALASAC